MKEKIDYIIASYHEGDNDVLDALLQLKKYEDELNECLDWIKRFKDENSNQIDAAASMHNHLYKGFEIKYRSGGMMFDFSKLQEYNIAKDNLKEIEDKYKQAYISKRKGLIPISEDGEELHLPEVKPRKGSIVIVNKNK